MIPRNNNETNEDEPLTGINELNQIAIDWSPSDGLPEDIHRERVETICHSLAGEVEDTVAGLKENTTLSELEALVWVLNNVVEGNHGPLTSDAIAICLSIEGEAEGWLTPDSFYNVIDSAQAKYDEAKQMVGEITFPNRNEKLDVPKVVWLDYLTIADLRYLAKDDETTLDDVVSRLANDAKTVLDVREFVEKYLDARGKESVAQLAVSSELIVNGWLPVVSHTSAATESLPQVVTETDAVEVDGQIFDLSVQESPYAPQVRESLTLYSSESISGMDAVDLETGLNDLKAAITETTISFEELVGVARDRMDAEVVTAEEPSQDTLRARVFIDHETSPGTDRFHHINEIQIEDDVYEANVTQHNEIPESPSGTVVWGSGEIDGVEKVSIDDGIALVQEELSSHPYQIEKIRVDEDMLLNALYLNEQRAQGGYPGNLRVKIHLDEVVSDGTQVREQRGNRYPDELNPKPMHIQPRDFLDEVPSSEPDSIIEDQVRNRLGLDDDEETPDEDLAEALETHREVWESEARDELKEEIELFSDHPVTPTKSVRVEFT